MKKQPRLVDLARKLRREITPAEKILWKHLRGRRFAGFKFRRQYPTGRYILDFYCAAKNLVLEIDGETHLGKETNDRERQKWIEAQGCKVLRFWNTEVYDELDSVLEAIWLACQEKPTTSGRVIVAPLSRFGRGVGVRGRNNSDLNPMGITFSPLDCEPG